MEPEAVPASVFVHCTEQAFPCPIESQVLSADYFMLLNVEQASQAFWAGFLIPATLILMGWVVGQVLAVIRNGGR